MGERRGVYRILVGKPEGRRAFWRPWLRFEDNIKVDMRNTNQQDALFTSNLFQ